MSKASTTTKIPKSNVKTQKRHQNLDYTTIADPLRTVSWSDNIPPDWYGLLAVRDPNLPTYHNIKRPTFTHVSD